MAPSASPTWVEIDLNALAHNVKAIRARLPEQTALFAVVKANAYGHGAVEVARAALAAGADGLCVARVAEGLVLREAGIRAPIWVLGWMASEEAPACARARLTPTVNTLEQAEAQLRHVDGVMLGRAVYHDPMLLAQVDARFYGDADAAMDEWAVLSRYRAYLLRELEAGVALRHMTRHLLGLFHGRPGARQWRRILSTEAPRKGAGIEVFDRALESVSRATGRPAA